ncbi:hypothetical protein BBJ28_00019887, partial [Nothophytophthora sp. Chile5]
DGGSGGQAAKRSAKAYKAEPYHSSEERPTSGNARHVNGWEDDPRGRQGLGVHDKSGGAAVRAGAADGGGRASAPESQEAAEDEDEVGAVERRKWSSRRVHFKEEETGLKTGGGAAPSPSTGSGVTGILAPAFRLVDAAAVDTEAAAASTGGSSEHTTTSAATSGGVVAEGVDAVDGLALEAQGEGVPSLIGDGASRAAPILAALTNGVIKAVANGAGQERLVANGRDLAEHCGFDVPHDDGESAAAEKMANAVVAWAATDWATPAITTNQAEESTPTEFMACMTQEMQRRDAANAKVLCLRAVPKAAPTREELEAERVARKRDRRKRREALRKRRIELAKLAQETGVHLMTDSIAQMLSATAEVTAAVGTEIHVEQARERLDHAVILVGNGPERVKEGDLSMPESAAAIFETNTEGRAERKMC